MKKNLRPLLFTIAIIATVALTILFTYLAFKQDNPNYFTGLAATVSAVMLVVYVIVALIQEEQLDVYKKQLETSMNSSKEQMSIMLKQMKLEVLTTKYNALESQFANCKYWHDIFQDRWDKGGLGNAGSIQVGDRLQELKKEWNTLEKSMKELAEQIKGFEA